jgi:hypothetical protein
MHNSYLTVIRYSYFITKKSRVEKQKQLVPLVMIGERVMGLEPTISCLGSKRSTTELHPLVATRL